MLVFSSCLNEDSKNVTYTSDTAITAFSIGTLKRVMYTKAHDGILDSSYVATVDGSKYKFRIDHNNGVICNDDSLPIRTQTDKVICSISAYNNGIITYLKPNNDTIYYFNSTDSMDFTTPLEFRVYPADGMGAYRKYQTSINVHQQNGDSLYWKKLDMLSEIPTHKKLLVKGDECFVFNTDVDKDIMMFKGDFYALHEGKLEKSDNGKMWTTVADFPYKTLLGAGTMEMYAISEERNIYSSKDGIAWTQDDIDGDVALLPDSCISCVCKPIKSNLETEQIVIIGNSNADAQYATVWTKVLEKREGSDKYSWTMARYIMDETMSLPHIDNLSVSYYADALLSVCNGKLYVSYDNGLLWKEYTDKFYLPWSFTQLKGGVASTASNKNFYLLEENGSLWQGLVPRMTWQKQDLE